MLDLATPLVEKPGTVRNSGSSRRSFLLVDLVCAAERDHGNGEVDASDWVIVARANPRLRFGRPLGESEGNPSLSSSASR